MMDALQSRIAKIIYVILAVAAFNIALNPKLLFDPESPKIEICASPDFNFNNIKAIYSETDSGDLKGNGAGIPYVESYLSKLKPYYHHTRDSTQGSTQLSYAVENGLCLPPAGGGLSICPIVFDIPKKITITLTDIMTGKTLLRCTYERGVICYRPYPHEIADDIIDKIKPFVETSSKEKSKEPDFIDILNALHNLHKNDSSAAGK